MAEFPVVDFRGAAAQLLSVMQRRREQETEERRIDQQLRLQQELRRQQRADRALEIVSQNPDLALSQAGKDFLVQENVDPVTANLAVEAAKLSKKQRDKESQVGILTSPAALQAVTDLASRGGVQAAEPLFGQLRQALGPEGEPILGALRTQIGLGGQATAAQRAEKQALSQQDFRRQSYLTLQPGREARAFAAERNAELNISTAIASGALVSDEEIAQSLRDSNLPDTPQAIRNRRIAAFAADVPGGKKAAEQAIVADNFTNTFEALQGSFAEASEAARLSTMGNMVMQFQPIVDTMKHVPGLANLDVPQYAQYDLFRFDFAIQYLQMTRLAPVSEQERAAVLALLPTRAEFGTEIGAAKMQALGRLVELKRMTASANAADSQRAAFALKKVVGSDAPAAARVASKSFALTQDRTKKQDILSSYSPPSEYSQALLNRVLGVEDQALGRRRGSDLIDRAAGLRGGSTEEF